MTFEEWLQEEFGEVQPYDFCSLASMNTWIYQMRKAFEAGHTQGYNEAIDEYFP